MSVWIANRISLRCTFSTKSIYVQEDQKGRRALVPLLRFANTGSFLAENFSLIYKRDTETNPGKKRKNKKSFLDVRLFLRMFNILGRSKIYDHGKRLPNQPFSDDDDDDDAKLIPIWTCFAGKYDRILIQKVTGDAGSKWE